MDKLTKQELKILSMIADGYRRSEITDKLFITRYTVDDHRQHIREKTGALTTADMVKLAIKLGLTDSEPKLVDYWIIKDANLPQTPV